MSEPNEQDHSAETRPDGPPRIYVASLGDYNAGTLHGLWLQADQDPDDLHEQITEMLAASPTTHMARSTPSTTTRTSALYGSASTNQSTPSPLWQEASPPTGPPSPTGGPWTRQPAPTTPNSKPP